MQTSALPSPLITALLDKKTQVQKEFERRHKFAKNWLEERGVILDQIREHSQKLLTSATLGSALLLSAPKIPHTISQPLVQKTQRSVQNTLETLKQLQLVSLNANREQEILQDIKQFFGVNASFELDHNRLPVYLGSMGLEQHLLRFPGDILGPHEAFAQEGMAPGPGAFGYFRNETEEKFYIVLQTFMIPNWNKDWVWLKKWYQFRKFLVINPENGRGVIAVLGDSGPGTQTGKQFGGSPEVMAGLGFYPKRTRGDVVVLFLDDPGNTIPLGPVFIKEK